MRDNAGYTGIKWDENHGMYMIFVFLNVVYIRFKKLGQRHLGNVFIVQRHMVLAYK